MLHRKRARNCLIGSSLVSQKGGKNKMTIKCYKVKDRKQTRIPKSKCTKREIEKLLNQGYAVSKITERKQGMKIETFSPMTREQALKQHRKVMGGVPF